MNLQPFTYSVLNLAGKNGFPVKKNRELHILSRNITIIQKKKFTIEDISYAKKSIDEINMVID